MEEHSQRMMQAVREMDFDLRNIVRPQRRVLRKLPPVKTKPMIARPKLNLADYVEEVKVPAAVHRSHMEFPWGMLLNDQIGDCGEAMSIHGVEAFHLDAQTPVPPFGDPEAEREYEDVGGYVPGDPSTDQGTDNQTLVDYWRDTGIKDASGLRHFIEGSLFIDPQNRQLAKLAIWEFVVLFRALGLPITAQGQTYWRLADGSLRGDAALGSWGYHDIPYLSYDSRRLRNVTWGDEYLVDWDFDEAYAVQGLIVITHEQTNLRGVSPSGVNWTKLNQDLAQFPPARAQN